MIDESRETIEIDLVKLLMAFLSKWWLIVICVLAGTLLAGYCSAKYITPMYRANATIYVNNVRNGEQINYITSSNLDTAQRLVNTYIKIIQSDSVLEKVAKATGLNISAAEIRAIMSASQDGDTELLKLAVTHADPVIATRVANTIAEVAPSEIESFVEGSSTKVIDYAKVPQAPSSPNIRKNSMMGGMFGCLLALLYLTVRFLMDVRIKDAEDLDMLFAIPVLGQIPAFESVKAKHRNGYGYGYETVAEQSESGAREGKRKEEKE